MDAIPKTFGMNIIFTLFLFNLSVSFVAADPDMLQDLCVADLANTVNKLNGYPCKDPATITESDFFTDNLANPAPTNTTMGTAVTPAYIEKIPGLNTLGIAMSRIDYAPGSLNPPHFHPRASEILFMLEGGQLDVGFITTSNKLVTKTLKKGDIFVFPRGLVHFQKNNCQNPAAVIVAFNSQFPGTQSLGTALFGATPPVPDDVLNKAFQVDSEIVSNIKTKFPLKK